MFKTVNMLGRSKALNDLFVAGALGLVEADWEPGIDRKIDIHMIYR